MIRVNPHFNYVEPNCTYDQASGGLGEAENDLSAENLCRLEARVGACLCFSVISWIHILLSEELEGMLNPGEKLLACELCI
jgi:hypothetical protein